MRSTPGLHVEWVEDEAVVLDPLTRQLHYLNPAAAYFFALIQEYGLDNAVERIDADYPAGTALRDGLEAMAAEMREKGLLIDD